MLSLVGLMLHLLEVPYRRSFQLNHWRSGIRAKQR